MSKSTINIFFRQMKLILIGIILLSFLGSGFSETISAASVANTPEPSFSIVHSRWNTTLDQAERQISGDRLNKESAETLRGKISEVREASLEMSLEASEKSGELKKLSDALGPLPKEGEPLEAHEVAQERRKLERLLRETDGQVKQSDLISKRSDMLLHGISTVEIDQIVSTLAKQDPLPLDPRVWVKAGSQFFNGYKSLIKARKEGGYQSPILTLIPVLGVGISLAILVGYWLRRGLLIRFQRDASVEVPSYGRRVFAAIRVGVTRGLIPAMVLAVLCGIAWIYWLKDALDPQFTWPRGIFYGVIFYLIGSALVRAVFSPRLPQWNLTWVTHDASKRIAHRLNLLMVIIALGIAFEAVLVDTGKAAEFGSVYAFIKNTMISLILLFLSRKSLWQPPDNIAQEGDENWIGTARLWFWPYLRFMTGVIALAALICSILGFHNIADFILPRVILTVLLAASFVTLRVSIRESFSLLLEKETSVATSLRGALAFNQDAGRRLNFWIMTIVDLFAILAAAYLLLVLWKFPHQDLVHWLSGWFNGISIGSYTFSLADVMLAFVVMFGVVTLTRVIRALLENRLLPQTNMDIGVRTAVSSGVGYIGVLLAMVMALSILGIDLTKLALIAGALSVGIGFGLQNIVNNFVSGLVLLFERPIKIGDWVVVGALEGKVKQINVRSTEIETFSRASVIIPNSDLLQTAVVNWTHKSSFGRLEIPVGVGYGSDIEKVEALLLECADAQPEVLSWPGPYVYFLDFGDSSLDFQLYIFVENIERRMRISSELRKCIMMKFREAGIEIPFPQRVVTLNKEQASGADQESPGSSPNNENETSEIPGKKDES